MENPRPVAIHGIGFEKEWKTSEDQTMGLEISVILN